VLPADAVAVELFDCVVAPPDGVLESDDPPSRGIQIWISVPSAPEPFGSVAAGSIDIETFALVGATCSELDVGFASCVVGAL